MKNISMCEINKIWWSFAACILCITWGVRLIPFLVSFPETPVLSRTSKIIRIYNCASKSITVLFFVRSVYNGHKYLDFDQKGRGGLGSNLEPFVLKSNALLTLPLSPGHQCSYLNYQATAILLHFLVVFKCTKINWVSVHLSSVVFTVSWPLQQSVSFGRFIH